jgi:adenylyltransferase/sulfurtransferase
MNGERTPGAPPAPELDPALLQLCYAEAAQAYPEEACGLLIGARGEDRCDEARPCRNHQNLLHALDPQTFPRDASRAYSLEPKDLRFLDQSLSGPRPVKIIYHSHVDVGAYFSAEDRAAALYEGELIYPVDYLVIDAGPTGVRGARLFRFQGGDFIEIARYDENGRGS